MSGTLYPVAFWMSDTDRRDLCEGYFTIALHADPAMATSTTLSSLYTAWCNGLSDQKKTDLEYPDRQAFGDYIKAQGYILDDRSIFAETFIIPTTWDGDE